MNSTRCAPAIRFPRAARRSRARRQRVSEYRDVDTIIHRIGAWLARQNYGGEVLLSMGPKIYFTGRERHGDDPKWDESKVGVYARWPAEQSSRSRAVASLWSGAVAFVSGRALAAPRKAHAELEEELARVPRGLVLARWGDATSVGRPCRLYMKLALRALRFLGDSLKRLREFPKDAQHDAGYQLDQVQRGRQPAGFKPMPSIGKGV